jgi:hypothetical protein
MYSSCHEKKLISLNKNMPGEISQKELERDLRPKMYSSCHENKLISLNKHRTGEISQKELESKDGFNESV